MIEIAQNKQPKSEVYEISSKDVLNPQNNKSKKGGIDISFKNLTYTIDINEKDPKTKEKKQYTRTILDNVSGICKQGELTAIMGSSGAGKTSLLNLLCKRVSESKTIKVEGSLKANDMEYSYNQFSDFASYIMQDDRLLEELTVKETLMFAANLKIKGTHEEKEKKVDQIIRALKLEKCKNTFIGGHNLKGVSGGERKRVSIAFELVSDPKVLFLDEPTSGLDSFTAFLTINLIKNMAKELNKTVVITIHSPSSDIWNLFDNFMLLVQGKFVYQGPGGNAVVDHFAKLGFQCPVTSNPADYLMTICHKEKKENVDNYEKYFDGYKESLHENVMDRIAFKSSEKIEKGKAANSLFSEMIQVGGRTFKQMMRNPIQFQSRLFTNIFLSLFLSALYWQLEDGKDDPTNIRALNDYTGYLFFQSVLVFFNSCMPVVLTFPKERAVFLKEENGKLYRVFSYYVGKIILEFPFLLILCLVECLIQFFMVGLRAEEEVFMKFLLTDICIALTGNAVGILVGCLFPDAQTASEMVDVFVTPLMMFAGFFSNRDAMWKGLSWVEYVSPFKYGFTAFAQNEFEVTYFRPNPLDTFNLDTSYWESIIIMVCLFMVLNVVNFTLLFAQKKKLQ